MMFIKLYGIIKRNKPEIFVLKNILKTCFIIVPIAAILIALFCLYVFNFRFMTLSPMPDLEYKIQLVKDSGNILYNVESLRPLLGREELIEFIKENDNNPQIYTPSSENIEKGIFRATPHMHTTNSDGAADVREMLDRAQLYAKTTLPENEYMYIGITDHNTVLGAKEVIDVLEKHPFKYNRIKVVAGIEIFTNFQTDLDKKPVEVHVLVWCINPYNKYLKNMYYVYSPIKNMYNQYNEYEDFQDVINIMPKYGIMGIAHPGRYSYHLGKRRYPFIDELYTKYLNNGADFHFTEGYYQSYKIMIDKSVKRPNEQEFLEYTIDKAKDMKMHVTGSVDGHQHTIFHK